MLRLTDCSKERMQVNPAVCCQHQHAHGERMVGCPGASRGHSVPARLLGLVAKPASVSYSGSHVIYMALACTAGQVAVHRDFCNTAQRMAECQWTGATRQKAQPSAWQKEGVANSGGAGEAAKMVDALGKK